MFKPNIIHITSSVKEKMQFNHFPIIILWDLSDVMITKQKGSYPNFSYFKSPYPSNIPTW